MWRVASSAAQPPIGWRGTIPRSIRGPNWPRCRKAVITPLPPPMARNSIFLADVASVVVMTIRLRTASTPCKSTIPPPTRGFRVWMLVRPCCRYHKLAAGWVERCSTKANFIFLAAKRSMGRAQRATTCTIGLTSTTRPPMLGEKALPCQRLATVFFPC